MDEAAFETLRVRDEKLRWHCRRALLELDIVFQRFWAAQGAAPLCADDAAELQALLALEDHPLWDLISGREVGAADADGDDKKLLARLRTL